MINNTSRTPNSAIPPKKNNAMTPVYIGLVIMGVIIALIFIKLIPESDDTKEEKIYPPQDAEEFQGENYEDVAEQFHNAGFVQVKYREVDDLITGWIVKEGSVETVTINGSDNYEESDAYTNDAKVVIAYHTFPEEESTSSEESGSASKNSGTSSEDTGSDSEESDSISEESGEQSDINE